MRVPPLMAWCGTKAVTFAGWAFTARAICRAASTRPPGVCIMISMGTSESVIRMALITCSESLISMYFITGKPRILMVSCL